MKTTYLAGSAIIGTGEQVIADAAVTVDAGKITYAGPRPGAGPDLGETVRLGEKTTLLPGLIDSHVHLAFDASNDPVAHLKAISDEHLLLQMAMNAGSLIEAGITTARDCGGRGFLPVVIKESIELGTVRGPHLLISIRPITTTGGHCYFMGGRADTAEECRKISREHIEAGCDFLKVMATGGMMTKGSAPWFPQYDRRELEAITNEGRRVGKKTSAHCHGTEGIVNAVHAGVDTIEHCSWLMPQGYLYDEETAGLIAEKGIYVCPTTTGHMTRWLNDPQMSDRSRVRLENLKKMVALGVKLAAGTDAGINNVPFDSLVGGLEDLELTGMSRMSLVEVATRQAAEALGVDQRTGTLEAGKDADVLAVAGNPLDGLGSLRRVALVLRSGQVMVDRRHQFAA
ncbi:MAG TPA: amidohydrolase family protein [Bacillota bacterium]|nr:amidohydrolase family protein [Bacillota bacterium]